MKALIALAVALAVAAASLAYLSSVGVINIEGTVSVPESRESVSVSPPVIKVGLNISNSSGEVVEEGVGVLRVEKEAGSGDCRELPPSTSISRVCELYVCFVRDVIFLYASLPSAPALVLSTVLATTYLVNYHIVALT